MRRVAVGELRRMLPLAGEEDALPGDEDAVENDDARRLAVLVREQRRPFARSSCRPGNDRHPVGIAGDRAAHGECGVGLAHVAARHDEEFVHIGRAGDDRLRPRDDDSLAVLLDDVDVAVGVRLLVRPLAAVALGVGHGDADAQVLVLEVVQVGGEALAVARPVVGVDSRRRLGQRAERVVGEVALCAAGLLAQDANGLELVEQVGAALVDVKHPVHGLAARRLHRAHDRRELVAQGEVVGQADGVDSRLQRRRVDDAFDARAVDEDARRVTAQRFTVVGRVHQHDVFPGSACTDCAEATCIAENGRSRGAWR